MRNYIIANILDSWSTWTALSLGAVEGNPLMATYMRWFDVETALILKVLVAVAVGWWSTKFTRRMFAVRILAIMLSLAAVNNSLHAISLWK